MGEFFQKLDISAVGGDVYIPVSIASGKKTTGFIYQIEGTAKGAISTTTIECDGEGITQITLGTIVYSKIPVGKTATFRILIVTKGQMKKEYRVVINQINYKLDPGDARYVKEQVQIGTKFVQFK